MALLGQLRADSLSTRWRSFRRAPSIHLARPWRSWLLDPGSLTQRLIDLSGGQFAVQLRFQGWGKATLSEARALSIDPRMRVMIREVQLLGCGQTWVYARSIIPATTLTGSQRKLRHLGNQSLGSLLFKDPTMHRGPIEITALRLPDCQEPARARRSVFYLNHKPLLVSEVFLPQLLRVQPQVQ